MLAKSPNGYRAGQIASTSGHGSVVANIKDGENIVAGRFVSLDPTTKEVIAYDGANPFGIAVIDHYAQTTLKDCLPKKTCTIFLYGVITAEKKAGEQFGMGDTFDIEADGTIKTGGDGSLGHIIGGDGVDTVLITYKGF